MPNGGSHLVPAAELQECKAQLEHLKHAAGLNYLSLKAIAEQLLPKELEADEEIEDASGLDYKTGYDAIIQIARLAVKRGEPGTRR